MCVGVRRFECAGVVVLVTIERAEAARQLYLAGVIWNSMVRCCVENGTEQPLRRTVQSSSRTPVSLSKSSRILLQLELNLSLSDSATFLNPLCDRWTPPVWLKNTPTSSTEHPRCTISPLSDLANCNRASTRPPREEESFPSVSSLVSAAWLHGVTSVYMISYLILWRLWVNNMAYVEITPSCRWLA